MDKLSDLKANGRYMPPLIGGSKPGGLVVAMGVVSHTPSTNAGFNLLACLSTPN